MAREMDVSQTAVSRIWRAVGLQPHRQETFKLSSDPLFVEKVRDIVVRVLHDLSGVGRNLQDHACVPVTMMDPSSQAYALSWQSLPRVLA